MQERRKRRRAVKVGLATLAGAIALGSLASVARPQAENSGKALSPAASADFWVEELDNGVEFPSSIGWLPDGTMLVLQRKGGLRAYAPDGSEGYRAGAEIEGLPTAYATPIADGLRDFAIDPDFSQNRRLFFWLTEGEGEQRHIALYRARLDGRRLSDLKRLYRTEDFTVKQSSSVATRLLFLADKTLLAGTAAPELKADGQRQDRQLGKVLRLDRDGQVPPDNPLAGSPGAKAEIWALGVRVPLGLARDSQGRIWNVDTGARGGDEINLLARGQNFGWGKAGWGFSYANTGADLPQQSAEGVEEPLLIWMPSVTPSSILYYEGSRFPGWKGDLFVSTLSGRALERIRLDETRQLVLRERLLIGLKERLRDVKQGPDGWIYVLTDHPRGRILRLRAGRPSAAEARREARPPASDYQPFGQVVVLGDPVVGKRLFAERCASCHSADAGDGGGEVGPRLGGVFERPIASLANFQYSPALRRLGQQRLRWTKEHLNAFIANPDAVAGTSMMAPPVADAKERGAIIAFLKSTGEANTQKAGQARRPADDRR